MSINVQDFLTATRTKRVKPKGTVINEATKRNYIAFNRELRNGGEQFKSGKQLVDFIDFQEGDGGWYNPKQRHNPTRKDGIKQIAVNWAFHEANSIYQAEETDLNDGSEAEAFFDIVEKEDQRCVVKLMNDLETSAWTLPNSELMESSSIGDEEARIPYSILAFVTRDGLEPSSTNGGIATGSTDFTTIQTLDPGLYANYKNQFSTYSDADPLDLTDGLLTKLELLCDLCQYETPSELKKYAEDETRSKQFIATTFKGRSLYRTCMKDINDQTWGLVNPDPSINGPQMQGRPVIAVDELATSWSDPAHPDFLVLDFNWMFPFFRTGWYMKEVVRDGGVDYPNSTVAYKFTMHNRICRSRRRQGRIYAA